MIWEDPLAPQRKDWSGPWRETSAAVLVAVHIAERIVAGHSCGGPFVERIAAAVAVAAYNIAAWPPAED